MPPWIPNPNGAFYIVVTDFMATSATIANSHRLMFVDGVPNLLAKTLSIYAQVSAVWIRNCKKVCKYIFKLLTRKFCPLNAQTIVMEFFNIST